MLKTIAEALVRLAPASVVKLAAKALHRFGKERAAHFVADRGSMNGVEQVLIRSSPRLRIAADGSRIAKISHFIGENAWEPGEADVWADLCAGSRNILEVGGNIGYFTVIGAAAARDARYTVVEPLPINLRSLRRNIAMNGLGHVRVVPAAVVGDPEMRQIRMSIPAEETDRQATGAYMDGAEGIDRPGTQTITVDAVHGAELASGVDLLKLDVEGAEAEILAAMEPAIAVSRPRIVLEVRRRTPQLRAWIKRFAEANGYTLQAIDSFAAIPLADIETVVLQEEYGTRDILMVPMARDVG